MKLVAKIVFIFTIFIGISKHSWAENKSFESFVLVNYDSLTNAVKNHDTANMLIALDKISNAYYKLDSSDRQTYLSTHQQILIAYMDVYASINQKLKAISSLKELVKSGYNQYINLISEDGYQALKDDKEVIAIMQPLRSTGDYLYILQRAGIYNNLENYNLPKFAYQDSSAPELINIRQTYHLDSIIGNGDEVTQILNLMHWVHNTIKHDGNINNPDTLNASYLIPICEGKRGLNCRGLAITLNDCYLAVGIKSRIVTCLPKDSLKIDHDCHVINSVFIKSLNKWIWVDPTNDAYIMDEKGNLLGIEEVRDRIVHNQPLILNPEANWNHKESITKNSYLYNYMAKNLYLLQSPIYSSYNYETPKNGDTISFITLEPEEYFNKSLKPELSKFEWKQNGKLNLFTKINYRTHNNTAFWNKPNE